MKAELTEGTLQGVLKLKITPENGLENYALDQWFKDWVDKKQSAEMECVCFRVETSDKGGS